jgi:pimeloyl-ACP methyl ester carboxylesterase
VQRQVQQIRACLAVLFPGLLLACAVFLVPFQADAELGGSMVASLWPRDAYPHGPVTFNRKAGRLEFSKPQDTAWWMLEDVPEGTYHVILTYAAALTGKRPAGRASVTIGDRSESIELPGKGGRALKRIAVVKDVVLSSSDSRLTVRLEEGAPGTRTVLYLWRVDLVDPRDALPEAGEAIAKRTPHGTYVQYIPYTARKPVRMLVSVHGTPGDGVDLVKKFSEDPSHVARDYMSVAHDQGLIVVYPAFDTPNFGGKAGPAGGYRGLFGREIRADDFLNEILDAYKDTFPSYDGRIYLHGHSAGAQFTNRYVVIHPDRVIGAVVSSAGFFAYPDPEKKWPAGMAPIKAKLRWRGDKEPREVPVEPNPEGWLKASTLPIAVVVGGLERTPPPKPNPNQKGANRVEYAENWMKDMRALAERNGRESRVEFFLVENCGHSGWKLAPAGFRYLFGE